MAKKRLFSGVQPSGRLHLGNYLGAIKQWIVLQEQHDALFCVVDLHAITVPQDSKELKQKTLEAAKMYMALGVDTKKAHIFVQSDVSAHAELAWILNTITKNGDLTKMTQFKDKSGVDVDRFVKGMEEVMSRKGKEFLEKSIGERKIDGSGKEILVRAIQSSAASAKEVFIEDFKEPFNSVGVGLFSYPVLMAADILLYDTDIVPVGEDQTQHLELTRTLANRFNKRFGQTFRIPRTIVQRSGARIMGLDDPMKKMSKSAASEYNHIALDDAPEMARKKIMKAVTDSGSTVELSDEKPALKNLLSIFGLLENTAPEEIAQQYVGKGYAEFKGGLADTVEIFLKDFQEKYSKISDDEARKVLDEGAKYAEKIAREKMKQVKEMVGLGC